MIEQCTVSICIPTYNETKHLSKLFSSIFKQTYTDFEVIISDDSTNDNVGFFVNELLKEHPALRYMRHTSRLGAPANWDYLQSVARGKYIKFLHHDDWFTEPNSLEIMVRAMEEYNVDFVFSASISHYIRYNIEEYNFPTENNKLAFSKDPTLLILCNHISTPSTTLFKRDIKIKFDLEMKWFVDVDFYIKYLLNHPNIYGIPTPLIKVIAFDDHNISNSCHSNKKIILKEHQMLLKKYYKLSKNKFRLNLSLYSLLIKHKITSVKEYKEYTEGSTISFLTWLLIEYVHFREFLIWKATWLKHKFCKK